jgi:para-nitrobenzyl esterase
MYHFTWPSPGIGGKAKATHTLEIPFVLENVDVAPVMTGDDPARYLLADRMSAAWAAFARTGDPNTAALPAWPTYDPVRRATMVFDETCALVDDPDRAARLALAELAG